MNLMNFLKKAISSAVLFFYLIFACLSQCAFAAGDSLYWGASVTAPDITADNAILYNATRDITLYEKNSEDRLYPASTTKVLTVLVIIDAVEKGKITLDETFAADSSIYYDIGSDGSSADIKPHEVLSVRDHLYCALLVSANEACNALALHAYGSYKDFVDAMNNYASSIGCENSHFANTHGMPNRNHYTTARDLFTIFKKALDTPLFAEICSAKSYDLPKTEFHDARTIYTTNLLLHSDSEYYYEPTLMGKTGTTTAAGSCLLSAAELDGERMIAVVMGSDKLTLGDGRTIGGCFKDAQSLYRWGYDTYDDREFIAAGDEIGTVPVKGGKSDHAAAIFDRSFSMYAPKTDNMTIDYMTSYNGPFKAPLSRGDIIGSCIIVADGNTVCEGNLLVKEDVAVSIADMLRDRWENEPSFKTSIFVFSGVFIALIAAVCALIILRRKDKKAQAAVIQPASAPNEAVELQKK